MIKKLIEVSIPLDLINDESAYDKMPGIGPHPKGLHHWWARLPLPTARAVLFASLVDDPSSHPDRFPTEAAQLAERERLFGLMRNLLQKKIHTKPQAYRDALEEIKKHCNGELPTVHDPFSGGGSIPLEGMRMGLPVIAADLNPVAVLINKAMLEILPRFANQLPINPDSQKKYTPGQEFTNARGLAEDVRYYGRLINEEAKKRIGHLYSPVTLPDGRVVPVLTYIWARTVECPNPACGCQMPLVRSFMLRTKKAPKYYTRPIIKRNGKNIITGYEVCEGEPEVKGTVNRRGATCIACGEAVSLNYIREEGRLGRISESLITITVDGKRGKEYLSPSDEHYKVINQLPKTYWQPEANLPNNPRDFKTPNYGLLTFGSLFTPRQLTVIDTFINLIQESHKNICEQKDSSEEYANAICTFLGFTADRLVDFNNSLARWNASNEKTMSLFARQAIPMVWDFGEVNMLDGTVGSWQTVLEYVTACIETVLTPLSSPQIAIQRNATKTKDYSNLLISTDPPYYDNIGYADLSDFFYVWLRRSSQRYYPDLLKTVLVPKVEELIASEYRHGGKLAAKAHFEDGFRETFSQLCKELDPRFPMTVYYAFKQEEGKDESDADDLINSDITLTTGWETMLEGLVYAGFQITATWPIKASQKWRMVSMGANALTSYIVLACRPRPDDSKSLTRQEFLRELRRELGRELPILQQSNLAPVDLAQAAIGPGMGVFSKYSRVLEQDGSSMRVRTALQLINRAVDEVLTEQEAEFDAETRWAIDWYSQTGHNEGAYGDADSLSRAKNTAVSGLAEAGIVRSGGGKVRLLRRDELSGAWDPAEDGRVVLWEITQHLIKQLQENGEIGAAKLYKQLGHLAEPARELAYRLFTICEKKGWSQDALAYNSLVLSWQDIVSESSRVVLTDRKGQYGLDF